MQDMFAASIVEDDDFVLWVRWDLVDNVLIELTTDRSERTLFDTFDEAWCAGIDSTENTSDEVVVKLVRA